MYRPGSQNPVSLFLLSWLFIATTLADTGDSILSMRDRAATIDALLRIDPNWCGYSGDLNPLTSNSQSG